MQFSGNAYLLAIPVIGIVIMLLPTEMREQLYLHLELAKHGEYWRFISGHFTYVSWLHWSLNTIGVFLFWLFFHETQRLKTWLPALIFLLILVSLGLMLLSVKLVWYAGFSGILTGLFAYGAVNAYFKSRIFSLGMLAILTIYIFMQLNAGELVDGGFITIKTSSYAHAIGLIAGIIYGLLTIAISGIAKQK